MVRGDGRWVICGSLEHANDDALMTVTPDFSALLAEKQSVRRISHNRRPAKCLHRTGTHRASPRGEAVYDPPTIGVVCRRLLRGIAWRVAICGNAGGALFCRAHRDDGR